ncbi:MAG: SpoIID/LytB domain-containing protein [Chroococcus sp. CMT-3BRIN-NPC107]|jgi:stage II sporulation protein D|nr:SpoIID/LytB domain-containing protein [Chroococcus sp. CMT-3BRIN-NPC107]
MNLRLLLTTQLPKRPWLLTLLLWIALVIPAQAAVQLRVAVENGVERLKIGSSTNAVVKDVSGRKLGDIAAMNAFYATPSEGGVAVDTIRSGAVWIEPLAGGYVYIGDYWYRGKALVIPSAKGLTAVNYVDLEQYLYSVLGSEMSASWPLEALKAQAVAARTYAIYKQQKERNALYDVTNTQSSQVYKGVASEFSSTQSAVNSTAGQVLTYNNQLILSVFHACSGGHTENVEDVWSEALPYLRGVQDYDQDITQCQWVKSFSGEELTKRLSGVGDIVSISPTLTPYGSIKSMKIVGTSGTRELKGEAVRNALGLKSTRFTITQEETGLRFDGRGWGHGLGLSQWGAYKLASRGINYRQILGHYYSGTKLTTIKTK